MVPTLLVFTRHLSYSAAGCLVEISPALTRSTASRISVDMLWRAREASRSHMRSAALGRPHLFSGESKDAFAVLRRLSFFDFVTIARAAVSSKPHQLRVQKDPP